MQPAPIHVPAIVLDMNDARALADVAFAAADLAASRGARINPRALRLAEQIRSASGITEHPDIGKSHPYEYERIDAATAADILGCSTRNVRALATRGRLPGNKQGKQWWFNRDDVEVFRDFR